MKRLSSVVLPLLPIWIAPFLLLSPLLLTGKTMYWGTPSLQFVPWRALAWDLIRSGEMPLWNPLVGMGAPLLANYQLAIFYPPNWALFILDAIGGVGWAAWGQGMLVFAHLAWAGTGMVFLAKRLGLGVLAQTICGLAFGLSGYLVARSGFLSINSALAWLPWILLFVLEIVLTICVDQRRPIKIVLILSLVLTMQLLAGHAQSTWYTLLLAVLWAGFWMARIARSRIGLAKDRNHDSKRFNSRQDKVTRIFRPWLWLMLGLLVALALAAGQLLPTGEYLLQSQRAGIVDYEYAMTYSFWPWRLITMLAPDMFGSPVTGDYWGYGNYWEDNIYIGLLPLIFALAAIIHAIKLARGKHLSSKAVANENFEDAQALVSVSQSSKTYSSFTFFLVIIFMTSIILALGKNTAIFPWLYQHIPTFSLFQAPTRFTIWAEVSLVLLAGLGIEVWHRPKGRALYWTRLATAGAFAITIGAGLTWLLLGDVSPTFIRSTVIAGILGVGTGILTLSAPERGQSTNAGEQSTGQRAWMISVVCFVMLDLLIAGWGLIPGVEQDFFTSSAPNAAEVHSQLNGRRVYLASDEEYRLKFDRFMRFDTFDSGEGWQNLRAAMVPNLFILDGIPSVNNFDPLVPNRYARWLENLETLSLHGGHNKVTNLLNLMGVGLVEFLDPNAAQGIGFNPLTGGARVRWVPCAYFTQTDGEALDRVFEKQDDYDVVVVLEGKGSPSNPDCSDYISTEQIFNITDTANQITISIATEAPGWLVISDTWYPGWRAYVDGVPVEIFRANYLFRAVQLSAGAHEVELIYRPLSFWLGMAISLIALGGISITWVVYRRRYGKSFH